MATITPAPHRDFRPRFSAAALAALVFAQQAGAQSLPASSVNSLKKLSLDELANLEVTSVSRRAEKLSEVASAIQVVTGDDIRRSGATSLPEALRLATNLQVAQIDSRQWAISARGFNSTTANKLPVLKDARQEPVSLVFKNYFTGPPCATKGVHLALGKGAGTNYDLTLRTRGWPGRKPGMT